MESLFGRNINILRGGKASVLSKSTLSTGPLPLQNQLHHRNPNISNCVENHTVIKNYLPFCIFNSFSISTCVFFLHL